MLHPVVRGHLAAVAGALRPVVLLSSGKQCGLVLQLLRRVDDPDEIEVQLVAHVLLFDDSLLLLLGLLQLHIFAYHQRRLILLSALFGVTRRLLVSIVRSITL